MPDFRLGEDSLTAETLVSLAQDPNPTVTVSDSVKEKALSFRQIVEKALHSDATYYGINTGFGYLSQVKIDKKDLETLQKNLIRSHACGVGDCVPPMMSRAILILRAHSFLQGYSGVRWETIQLILDCLKHDILPAIPEKGSVGACGDLAPLAHVALCLMGEGDVFYKGQRCSAQQAFQEASLKPLTPMPKEGLSLINGTDYMTALAAFAVDQALTLLLSADCVAAMSLDAFRGTAKAFDERIHQVRLQKGQQLVAKNLSLLFKLPDDICYSHQHCGEVQDPYSFRCIPQVHGSARDAWDFVCSVVNNELNAVTDNPLVFENGDIISGGNFHGEPIAMAMDFLAIAVAELGSISEQRIMKLTNPHLSKLPAFLVKDSGLNSGFMIPHVVAASLVSENKILCHPASIDSLPTSADKEDHVSMGPIAAQKALQVCKNVSHILAIELLAACQGIDLLAPLKPNKILAALHENVRKISPFIEQDRALSHEITQLNHWILQKGVITTVKRLGFELH